MGKLGTQSQERALQITCFDPLPDVRRARTHQVSDCYLFRRSSSSAWWCAHTQKKAGLIEGRIYVASIFEATF